MASHDRSAAHALIEAELRWTDAVRRGDRDGAGAYMADEFTSVTAGSRNPPVDRAAWMKRVARPSTLESFAAADFEVHIFGELAMVQSRCEEHARRGAHVEVTSFRFGDIWHRIDGTWKVGYRHVSLNPASAWERPRPRFEEDRP